MLESFLVASGLPFFFCLGGPNTPTPKVWKARVDELCKKALSSLLFCSGVVLPRFVAITMAPYYWGSLNYTFWG